MKVTVLICQIAPKNWYSGAKIVSIAANLDACLLNQGNKTILHILHLMKVKIGHNINCSLQRKVVASLQTTERKMSHLNVEGTAQRMQKIEEFQYYEE